MRFRVLLTSTNVSNVILIEDNIKKYILVNTESDLLDVLSI